MSFKSKRNENERNEELVRKEEERGAGEDQSRKIMVTIQKEKEEEQVKGDWKAKTANGKPQGTYEQRCSLPRRGLGGDLLIIHKNWTGQALQQ